MEEAISMLGQALADIMQQVVRQEVNNAVLQISKQISKQQQQGCNKDVLTTTEAAQYLGIENETLLKKVHDRLIGCCKQGRMLYFKRSELDAYMLANYVAGTINYQVMAQAYASRNPVQELKIKNRKRRAV